MANRLIDDFILKWTFATAITKDQSIRCWTWTVIDVYFRTYTLENVPMDKQMDLGKCFRVVSCFT